MNHSKKKAYLTAIYICTALILTGVAIAILSLKFDFPKAWSRLGYFMSLAGSGGVGVIIALYVHSIPNQNKYHENRLKAKAWKDLGVCFYSLIVGGIPFYYIIRHSGEVSILNTLPARVTFLCMVIIVGIWVAVGPFIQKKRLLKGLDERERLIYENAKIISDSIFGGLCLVGFLGIFVWFGPKTPIPVFVPVLMFFTIAFIGEIAKPVIILIQCSWDKTSEGETK